MLDVTTDLDLALDDLVGGSVVIARQAGKESLTGGALEISGGAVGSDAIDEAFHQVSRSFLSVGVEMLSTPLAVDLDREDSSFFAHTNLSRRRL